jgi:hypothetical protein
MTTNDFDFNSAGEQRTFEVIPAGTIVTLQMTIRAGGAGDDGWLKKSADGNSEGLDCEFIVVDGEHARRKLFQRLTLKGNTPGHKDAGDISQRFLRAVLESSHGIRPDDTSEAAQAKRRISGFGDFNNLRFIARLGVRGPQNGYEAKNTVAEVMTPKQRAWKPVEQLSGAGAQSSMSFTTSSAPQANAITRPDWAKD